jgi:hypothetical protein
MTRKKGDGAIERNAISGKWKYLIGKRLHEVCSQDAEGYAVYVPGENDQTVADTVGDPVQKANVITMREELFGNIKRRRVQPDKNYKQSRIDNLEVQLLSLTEKVTAMTVELANMRSWAQGRKVEPFRDAIPTAVQAFAQPRRFS